jgi:thiol-disulfide isomerase/thioredoxin
VLSFIGVGAAAALAGAWLAPHLSENQKGREALEQAQFTDMSGRLRTLSEWPGRVLVLNFWATWCAPCREEIPALVKIRDQLAASGLEIVGIAIDQAAKVAQFAKEVPISYPLLLAGGNGLDLIRALGNPSGGLPFTVVLSRDGHVAERHLGAVSESLLLAKLQPLLKKSG